jgi:NTE family protein
VRISKATLVSNQSSLIGMKEMLIHSIRSDEAMCALSVSSKYNADWDFLCGLRDNGRRAAETWLAKNYRNIGQRSSIDMQDPG